MQVQERMNHDVVVINPQESLDHAYLLMREYDIRHLPVVDEGKLVGILAESDVLFHATPDHGSTNIPDIDVASAMTTDLVTCTPDTDLAEIAATMLACKLDSMPVTEGERLVGIITASDFIRLVLEWENEPEEIGSPFHHEMELIETTSEAQFH